MFSAVRRSRCADVSSVRVCVPGNLVSCAAHSTGHVAHSCSLVLVAPIIFLSIFMVNPALQSLAHLQCDSLGMHALFFCADMSFCLCLAEQAMQEALDVLTRDMLARFKVGDPTPNNTSCCRVNVLPECGGELLLVSQRAAATARSHSLAF